MSILECPDEEEAYLYAILSDPSGLDQAEFVFVDEQNEDACYRAWSFQWRYYRDESPLQASVSARSIGKTRGIVVKAFAFPFLHPGQEMVVTAPEMVHLEPLTDLIERQFTSCRIGQMMLPKRRGFGITHRPYHMVFLNGARIMGRIPQRDGRGIKGTHPLWLEADEYQDYGELGHGEIIETVKMGVPNFRWRVHGVPRGPRDHFYKLSEIDNNFVVHRYTAVHRPNWTNRERQDKIATYGSENSPDFKRNIYGFHGDSTQPLFVQHRLMENVDDDESSEYNRDVYQYYRLNHERIQDEGVHPSQLLPIPATHRKFRTIWIGVDIGLTIAPTEILVFAQEHLKKVGQKGYEVRPAKQGERNLTPESVFVLLSRIHLERVSHPDHVAIFIHLMEAYNPKAFSMDSTGIGLPMFQDLMEHRPDLATRVNGFGFGEKILVGYDETVEYDEDIDDKDQVAGIKRNVKEWSTDVLRDLVDEKRLWLPWDRELIGQFQGQSVRIVKSETDMYGRKRQFSGGEDHVIDAARMMALGWQQHYLRATEDAERVRKEEPVLDVFI